jgi:hypothetical protein
MNTKTNRLLWLDDIRDPSDTTWQNWLIENHVTPSDFKITWVKNADDFVKYITENGIPEFVCFDHDLGRDVVDEKVANGMSRRQAQIQRRETVDGYDCAKWLVDYCVDNDEALPTYLIQSANPVGVVNINTYLQNFLKFQK